MILICRCIFFVLFLIDTTDFFFFFLLVSFPVPPCHFFLLGGLLFWVGGLLLFFAVFFCGRGGCVGTLGIMVMIFLMCYGYICMRIEKVLFVIEMVTRDDESDRPSVTLLNSMTISEAVNNTLC